MIIIEKIIKIMILLIIIIIIIIIILIIIIIMIIIIIIIIMIIILMMISLIIIIIIILVLIIITIIILVNIKNDNIIEELTLQDKCGQKSLSAVLSMRFISLLVNLFILAFLKRFLLWSICKYDIPVGCPTGITSPKIQNTKHKRWKNYKHQRVWINTRRLPC